MRRVFRQQKGFSLDVETVEIIETRALEDKTSNSRALDKIVREWKEFKQKEQSNDWKHILDDGGLEKELEELTSTSLYLYEELSELWLKIKTKTGVLEEKEVI